MDTFITKYGKITLYQNEIYIGSEFKKGNYWDEDTLLKLKQVIDPTKNILEIGGHCGTSSLVYASFLDDDSKMYIYEPQKNMFNLLVHNVNQNNLQHKMFPRNLGVFCYEGTGRMNNIDVDGGGGDISKRYTDESHLPCNFGGLALGSEGEQIELTMVDNMELENIGFIHCDAQGSENFIFSKAINTITKYRPVILYEDNTLYGHEFYNDVCKTYPEYSENSQFNIKKYCISELNYSSAISRFNGSIDTLLIP